MTAEAFITPQRQRVPAREAPGKVKPGTPAQHTACREQLREQRLSAELAAGGEEAAAAAGEPAVTDVGVFWRNLLNASQHDFVPEELLRLEPGSLLALARHYSLPGLGGGSDEAAQQLRTLQQRILAGEAPLLPRQLSGRQDGRVARGYNHLNYPSRRAAPLIPRDAKAAVPIVSPDRSLYLQA